MTYVVLWVDFRSHWHPIELGFFMKLCEFHPNTFCTAVRVENKQLLDDKLFALTHNFVRGD